MINYVILIWEIHLHLPTDNSSLHIRTLQLASYRKRDPRQNWRVAFDRTEDPFWLSNVVKITVTAKGKCSSGDAGALL